MACPNCRNVLRGADTISLPALLSSARATRGPLRFCDGCRAGDRGADGMLGLSPLEAVRALDRGADAPGAASGDLRWVLLYSAADGSIAYSITYGKRGVGGIIPAGTSVPAAQLQVFDALNAANIPTPDDFKITLPTSDVPVSQGAIPEAWVKGSRTATQKHRELLWEIAAAGLAAALVILVALRLSNPTPKHRKA